MLKLELLDKFQYLIQVFCSSPQKFITLTNKCTVTYMA